MTWSLSGKLVESCSCNMMCPCWYGVKELMKMDRGWCDSAIMYRVEQGKSDGTDLSGRSVALALAFPGPTLFDGNGIGRLYVDDKSTAPQRKELEAIFQGKKGGSWQAIAGLFAKWLPTATAKITVQESDGHVTATVGTFGQIRTNVLKNDQGQIVQMENAGFGGVLGVMKVDLAPSASDWRDPDLPRKFQTASGAVGKFAFKA